MDIDIRILDGRARVFRRSDGHVLGTVGKANPIKVDSNGDVLVVLYADGTIERYRAHSRVKLGSIRHRGALDVSVVGNSLYVIHSHGFHRYDPETRARLSPLVATGSANRQTTAIRRIRALASAQARKAA